MLENTVINSFNATFCLIVTRNPLLIDSCSQQRLGRAQTDLTTVTTGELCAAELVEGQSKHT